MTKEKIGYIIIFIITIVSLVGILSISPIEQRDSYHNFSDSDTILNISNFWNVVSNLPFLLVGIYGLSKVNLITKNKTPYLFFFIGVALVSIGSGYYHLNPNNSTLIWDRLPMTIAFMALCSVIISEYINLRIGQLILYPAILLGFSSVFYWMYFDDLRLYVFVQFYPMLVIPVVLIFFKSNYTRTIGYTSLLIAYAIAKTFEYFDSEIHHSIELLSGHTLKHLFASIGIYALIRTYKKRVERI